MKKRSFTLLEILVVIIIIGILATLGFSQYGAYKEKTLDREAQSNLLLILAGERIARLESNTSSYVGPANNNTDVNTFLRMLLPVTNPNWVYTIKSTDFTKSFCAQAKRTWGNPAQERSFYISSPTVTIPDPQPTTTPCS